MQEKLIKLSKEYSKFGSPSTSQEISIPNCIVQPNLNTISTLSKNENDLLSSKEYHKLRKKVRQVQKEIIQYNYDIT